LTGRVALRPTTPGAVPLHPALFGALRAGVQRAAPNLEKVAALPSDGLIITAKGDTVDFVSRYFAPHAGIP